jgi:hypothetical protein
MFKPCSVRLDQSSASLREEIIESAFCTRRSESSSRARNGARMPSSKLTLKQRTNYSLTVASAVSTMA